jgi:hypothetical protein
MIKIEKISGLDQKVSSQLAFIFILLLSFVVAWYTIDTGQEIVENAKTSTTFNVYKRVNNNVPVPVLTRPN